MTASVSSMPIHTVKYAHIGRCGHVLVLWCPSDDVPAIAPSLQRDYMSNAVGSCAGGASGGHVLRL